MALPDESVTVAIVAPVLTSMPGIGVRTAARILLEVGDGTAFATPGHLASYAGLAPVTRRSGNSIRGEGNRHNAALICLARRRCDVLFAMLRDNIPYQPRPPSPIPA